MGQIVFTPHRYFTDESVLSRVPDLFLLLGGIFIVMGLTAAVLVREGIS